MGVTGVIAGVSALAGIGSAAVSRQSSIDANNTAANAAATQEKAIQNQQDVLQQNQVQSQLEATRNAQYLQVRRDSAAAAGAVGQGSTYATGTLSPPSGGKTLIGQ